MVITEGISDFHAYSAICKEQLKKAKFEFVPGLGAGASAPLISFLIASGQPFIVLLDDDAAGKKEAGAYREKWYLTKDTVFTLKFLDDSLQGKKLETLISDKTHKIICNNFSKEGNTASKKEIGIYFAEKNYTTLEKEEISSGSRDVFHKIVRKINDLF